MRPIVQSYERVNEYVCSLNGEPYYRNSGVIYAIDEFDDKYTVGRIDFERYDDQNFQYVFSPEWSVIDALPPDIFQGIPGLDLSLRLEKYYRVNMTPCFISERTPGEGREDLWELLEQVGLDYYDRFEWLIRTDMRAGVDNLIVERIAEPRRIKFDSGVELPENLQPGDCIVIQGMDTIALTSKQLRDRLSRILCSGAQIWNAAEERYLSKEECSTLLSFLIVQEKLDRHQKKKHHQEGVEKAKQAGKYSGRKRISIDYNLLEEVIKEFDDRKITEEEAMKRIGIASRSTFYRRLKEFRME